MEAPLYFSSLSRLGCIIAGNGIAKRVSPRPRRPVQGDHEVGVDEGAGGGVAQQRGLLVGQQRQSLHQLGSLYRLPPAEDKIIVTNLFPILIN